MIDQFENLHTADAVLNHPITTGCIIYRMEKVISLDKKYWKSVLDGELAVNPVMLKRIVNRLLGKAETGDALKTESVLAALKPDPNEALYWLPVLEGLENANPEKLKQLFSGLV